MDNYICVYGQHIELTEDQIDRIVEARNSSLVKLSELPVGEIAKIGEYEFIVLEHSCGGTSVILKDILPDATTFGETNNYKDSTVDKICTEFGDKIANVVGTPNIIVHQVDLISDDGLDNYGFIYRDCSLITAADYRKFVRILDKFNPDAWWWLATAHSTAAHGSTRLVKCVAPSGYIYYYDCNCYINGVRPFLILKSDIFVSR